MVVTRFVFSVNFERFSKIDGNVGNIILNPQENHFIRRCNEMKKSINRTLFQFVILYCHVWHALCSYIRVSLWSWSTQLSRTVIGVHELSLYVCLPPIFRDRRRKVNHSSNEFSVRRISKYQVGLGIFQCSSGNAAAAD